jgi:hypothetical protein
MHIQDFVLYLFAQPVYNPCELPHNFPLDRINLRSGSSFRHDDLHLSELIVEPTCL